MSTKDFNPKPNTYGHDESDIFELGLILTDEDLEDLDVSVEEQPANSVVPQRLSLSLESKHLDDAKKLIELNMPGPALMSCRNALESLVKDINKRAGLVYDSRESDLSVMIDQLFENGLIQANLKDLLHRSRIICNKGAHIDSNVNINDAQEALSITLEAYSLISTSIDDDTLKHTSQINNVPMVFPDYYSRERRYYGKWSHCYDRNELLVIPEYVALLDRAFLGDVDAMLDIAVGFLPQKGIYWSPDMLVRMPPYRYKGQEYSEDRAVDYRYYYWISEAVRNTFYQMESFPRKYIATAIWEMHKYWFHEKLQAERINYVSGVYESYDQTYRRYVYNPIYSNPDALIENMFGIEDADTHLFQFGILDTTTEITREIFKGVDYCDFVAPVFEDAKRNPYFKLLYLENCGKAIINSAFLKNEEDFHRLDTETAQEINDDYSFIEGLCGTKIDHPVVSPGDVIDWEMLKPYTVGAFCNKYYNSARVISNQYLAYEKNKQKTGFKVKSFLNSLK